MDPAAALPVAARIPAAARRLAAGALVVLRAAAGVRAVDRPAAGALAADLLAGAVVLAADFPAGASVPGAAPRVAAVGLGDFQAVVAADQAARRAHPVAPAAPAVRPFVRPEERGPPRRTVSVRSRAGSALAAAIDPDPVRGVRPTAVGPATIDRVKVGRRASDPFAAGLIAIRPAIAIAAGTEA